MQERKTNNKTKHNITYHRSAKVTSPFHYSMIALIFFVSSGLNQFFLNTFERSGQRSVQLNWSFSTLLTKYQEHDFDVVVPELHLDELNISKWVGRWMSILNIVHPPRIYVVDLMIDLVQPILPAIHRYINPDLEQILFSPVISLHRRCLLSLHMFFFGSLDC